MNVYITELNCLELIRWKVDYSVKLICRVNSIKLMQFKSFTFEHIIDKWL